jgi:hypothetical protein
MTFNDFERAKKRDLKEKANDCFRKYYDPNTGGLDKPALLLEAQFYMSEMDRRHQTWISWRDLILEIAVIVLIGIEIWLGSKQDAVLNQLQSSTAATASTLATLQGLTVQMNRAIQRQLRDRHLDLLRPVLTSESSQLKGIADEMKARARIVAMTSREAQDDPSKRLWPEPMSRDLEHHFLEYDQAKRDLLSVIEAQDREFRSALSAVETQVLSERDLTPEWKENAALAFVEKCLGHGEGIKLRIFDSGYSFEYMGGTTSGSGGGPNPPRPSPDQIAAFDAFQALKMNAMVDSHCKSLKRRADAIIHKAEDLSKKASVALGKCGSPRDV